MTEKNIAANIPFGGGKAIIFLENRKSKKMLESFANFLNLLDGMYISAQDIGISHEDTKFIVDNYFGEEIFSSLIFHKVFPL